MNIKDLYSEEKIIKEIQKSLSVELLDKKHQYLMETHPYGGHCYAASEAFFYFFGGKEEWTPMMGRDENGVSHWWLKNKKNNNIIDITKKQYTDLNKEPPYINGKGRGFQKQSIRSLLIMEKVVCTLQLQDNKKGKELNKRLKNHIKTLKYKSKKPSI